MLTSLIGCDLAAPLGIESTDYLPGAALAAVLVALGLVLGANGTRDAITEFLSSLPLPSLAGAPEDDATQAPAIVEVEAAETPSTETVAVGLGAAPPAGDDHLLQDHPSAFGDPSPEGANAGSTDPDAAAATASTPATGTASGASQTDASTGAVVNPDPTLPDTAITLDEDGLETTIGAGPATTQVSVSSDGIDASLELELPGALALIAQQPLNVGVNIDVDGPGTGVGVTLGETEVEVAVPPLPVIEEPVEEEILDPVIEDLGDTLGDVADDLGDLGGLGGLFG